MRPMLDSLPVLYRDLLPEFFQKGVPVETKATCDSCAMCPSSASGTVESVDGVSRLFRPDTKCCTYYPRLPNFLVGALLSDDRPELAEGRRRMEHKLQGRLGITPQWVKASARYNLLYRNSRQFFGRALSMRCPYYEEQQGGCTIWPYREAVCSTFFCKYVAGADGRKFWMTLKTYLTLLEIQLSRYAVLQLLPEYILAGKDRPELGGDNPTVEELDERPLSDKEHAALWRTWAGREVDFYRACYDLVRALTPEQVEKLLGLDGVIELKVLDKSRQDAVSPVLPAVLKLNPEATVKWLPDGSVALGAYSEYDAVALPGLAYALLVEFTGLEPVARVRERLREQKQADLHEDILLELYRHRILTAP
jgi:Fe-S-cluster containining protein